MKTDYTKTLNDLLWADGKGRVVLLIGDSATGAASPAYGLAATREADVQRTTLYSAYLSEGEMLEAIGTTPQHGPLLLSLREFYAGWHCEHLSPHGPGGAADPEDEDDEDDEDDRTVVIVDDVAGMTRYWHVSDAVAIAVGEARVLASPSCAWLMCLPRRDSLAESFADVVLEVRPTVGNHRVLSAIRGARIPDLRLPPVPAPAPTPSLPDLDKLVRSLGKKLEEQLAAHRKLVANGTYETTPKDPIAWQQFMANLSEWFEYLELGALERAGESGNLRYLDTAHLDWRTDGTGAAPSRRPMKIVR